MVYLRNRKTTCGCHLAEEEAVRDKVVKTRAYFFLAILMNLDSFLNTMRKHWRILGKENTIWLEFCKDAVGCQMKTNV